MPKRGGRQTPSRANSTRLFVRDNLKRLTNPFLRDRAIADHLHDGNRTTTYCALLRIFLFVTLSPEYILMILPNNILLENYNYILNNYYIYSFIHLKAIVYIIQCKFKINCVCVRIIPRRTRYA